MKLSPKIIALDLDDTLLTDALTVSPHTVSVLAAAASQGIYVALNSGRTTGAVVPTMLLLGPTIEERRYILAQNGAVVRDLIAKKDILEVRVRADVLQDAYALGREAGMGFEIYDGETIYVPEVTKWTEEDSRLSALDSVVVPDYAAFLSRGWPKMVLSGEPEKMPPLEAKLRERIGERATIFMSKPFFLEVMPKDAGKGEGLLYLAERLGISGTQTMAFGDSMNDESMIRKAGCGVAMKNGRQAIKDMADYVTDYTNNEDGVARFIEKYVL